MTDDLKARVHIPSSELMPQENYNGTNMAYLSMKYAYHKMSDVQEKLRAGKNYEMADMIREAKDNLRDAYDYRFASDSIDALAEVDQ